MEMTEQEQAVMDITVQLWNAIKDLPILHASDIPEYLRDIHDIQNRIAARPIIRLHNNAKP